MTPVSGQGQLARLVAQGRLGRLEAPNLESALAALLANGFRPAGQEGEHAATFDAADLLLH